MKIKSLAASATLALLLVPGALSASAVTPASSALAYLGAHQAADGSLDGALGETADFVLSARAAGVDPNTLVSTGGKTPFDWFAADLATASPKSTANANATGKVIQALLAGGKDPKTFGGADLVATLMGFYSQSTGGFVAASDPNAAFSQANAILALETLRDSSHPVPPAALGFLRSLQDTVNDAPNGHAPGGWASFGQDNTNATALAVMALAAAVNVPVACGSSPGDSFGAPEFVAARTFLKGQQDPKSGGFPYSTLGQFGFPDSDPDSDALVIQALTAIYEDAAGSAWTTGAGNATSDILTFQDGATGGFSFDHASAPTVFTTSQVVPGLLRAPYPLGAVRATICQETASPPASPKASAPPVGLPAAGSGHSTPAPWAPGILLTFGVLALGAAHLGWKQRR